MDLTRTTLDLVRIPSVTGQEGALCDFVEQWARTACPEARLTRQGSNLVLAPPPLGGRPVIGLFGHLDTVPPDPNQPLHVAEGRIYGCGASDMKAGLALMMAALSERARHACDLVAVFYDGEEGPEEGNGLRQLMDLVPPMDLALVLEPTNNQIEAGCMGGIHARVVVEGRRAHSARPWQGQNAVYRALPVLERLRDRPRRERVVEGLTFYEVMTVTMARTDNAANVVPDRFELNVNVRFAPGRTDRDALEELREVVGDLARVELRDASACGAVCLDHPLVQEWIRLRGLQVRPKQAWTDLARLTGRGIPAVNFGPGDPARAHQAVEWVEEAALREGHAHLSALLGEVCLSPQAGGLREAER